jgi:hypothetical protein
MKAIALLFILVALAAGTYMNRDENHSAKSEDQVKSGLSAPIRENSPPAKTPQLEVPATTEIPL